MLICLDVFTFGNTCKEGERMSRQNRGCEPCPENYFSNRPNDSQQCQPCTKCKVDRGSKVVINCSKTSDTICQCRSGFISRDSVSSICKCPEGSGLEQSGSEKVCHPCPQGSFTARYDSECVPWKTCRSGVKTVGNKTSDVICNDDPESNGTKFPPIHPTSPTASPQTVSTMTTPHPTAASVTPVITSEGPKAPKSTENYENVITLIGVVLLLTVLLTAVTCKLIIIPCIKDYKNPTIITAQESLCRKPVEESGDSSLSSLVKPPTLEEP
ncbi:tumor necrosis factor receptor superfamily member 10C isoform X2 [Esox lucius]|uniref:TNFR-Cys domain-containing protein n=2 Tax=Esox lucius TaxID=8010 RepID=A0A3P8ZTA4_ESOLU|nr:tumor necrosis factor receptor superfamily member 10C isoform X2 [Esox lucius]